LTRFVEFAKKAPPVRSLKEEPGYDRWVPFSGSLVCELEVLTPLCIHSVFRNMQDSDEPFVPGSSLRGMVRNMAEMLGAGCGRLYERQSQLPACNSAMPCLVCRTFGFIDGDKGWAGKVRFRDARRGAGVTTTRARPAWVMCDVPFQRDPHQPGQGWIIFAHNPGFRPARGKTRCLDAGEKLQFRVDCMSLDSEEYAVLRFALTLQTPQFHLPHKIGYAKGAGFGGCRIRILSEKAPPLGPAIDPYLSTPGFRQIQEARLERS
jgi:hypothetical protein